MGISAFVPVFNEEKRIAHTLTSLKWCDEIILLDKYSTDRTVDIAKTFGDKIKIHFMENSEKYDATEFDYLKEFCTNEWIIIFTASDVINKKLVYEITKTINQPDFKADILYIPYRRYVLGLETSNSPWYTDSHPAIWKKSALRIDYSDTHNAMQFEGKKHYLKAPDGAAMYHLTHETVDGMTSRHVRYWKGEGHGFNDNSMKKPFKSILRSLYVVFLQRRTFLMGWNGIALACAYISYFLMSFVYKWEKRNGDIGLKYERLRNDVNSDWL